MTACCVRSGSPAYGARTDERDVLAFALAYSEALRPDDRRALYAFAGDCRDLAAMGLAGLRAATGKPFPRARWEPSEALESAKRGMDFCLRRGIGFVRIDEAEYPPLLRETHDPPFMLFHRGPLPDPERPCAAVVGTRRPSMDAFSRAWQLSRDLALRGVPVVSGLALGIDRAAHEGALSARGYTLAVLGSGIDSVYPRANSQLAGRILAYGGCLLSEYPPGLQALKYHFPERNRIVSGLCRSVLVAQAPARSGALITAEFALDQGRELFVMAGGTEGEAGAGARMLAEEGAAVALGAVDIVSEWGV